MEQQDKPFPAWPKMQRNVSMADYSTLRAGGRAAGFIDVEGKAELQELLKYLRREEVCHRVIGRGSNILVTDAGYPGVIIRLRGEFNRISSKAECADRGIIRVGAGCSMAKLISWCSKEELSGLEFMHGIPGSVGGAMRMNAGAWGKEIGSLVQVVELVDSNGQVRNLEKTGLKFSYRRLSLAAGEDATGLGDTIISGVTLLLRPGTEAEIRSRCADYQARRKGKQPAGIASAGSFFKNPANDSAGRLIEAAGLKGISCGDAMVSPVHANFIVNNGMAGATEIITLMHRVQKGVWKEFGVQLEPEVEII